MDTKQINSALRKCEIFQGTFPRDLLPHYVKKKPAAFVANTDPSNKKGEHWVAIVLNADNTGQYFDSFGLEPLSADIYRFLSLNAPNGWQCNRIPLQQITSTS